MLAIACNKEPAFTPELTVSILGETVEQGKPASIPFDFRGGSSNVKISCNTEWVLSCNYDGAEEEWLTLTASETALSISAPKNPGFVERSATVKISVKGYESVYRELNINQGAPTPTVNLSPASLNFPRKGGVLTFKVSANCDWTAVSSNPAFTLSPASGKEGETEVSLTAAENKSNDELKGTVTVTYGGSLSATLSFTQRPASGGNYIDENGVDRGAGIVIDGRTWAPVNCGYAPAADGEAGNPYGKYYQWGRKPGFNYDDGESNVDSGTRINVDGPVESIEKAVNEEFYKDSPNWLPSKVNDLWNSGTEADPVKTQYDPCPDGWRVPTETEMVALVQNKSAKVTENGILGYWFSGNAAYSESAARIFLPFAGCIASGSNSTDRGTAGWYWTSTVRATADGTPDIAIQIYAANWCNFNDWTDQRARAYTIRCIAE